MRDQRIIQYLEIIDETIEIIGSRFEKMESRENFVLSHHNLILLDAIAMRLQVVGEKVKMIEQRSPGYLSQHGIDAQPIIRFRDFISHHYEDVEYEIIIDVCRDHLPDLAQKIKILLAKG